MTAPTVDTTRRVAIPSNVEGLVYGMKGDYGTWFFADYGDLGLEVIEAKGGRIFRACEHDGSREIRDLPDDTVPLAEHVELLAKVEELHQRVDQLEHTLRTAAGLLGVIERQTHNYGTALTG